MCWNAGRLHEFYQNKIKNKWRLVNLSCDDCVRLLVTIYFAVFYFSFFAIPKFFDIVVATLI